MINKPPPFQGLSIRIPIIIPIKGRGFINRGSGLIYIEASSQIVFTPAPKTRTSLGSGHILVTSTVSVEVRNGK